ncbi:hypothetical protein [Nocardioides sp. CFH 31398]|uniref:hypothetical protein n=1 Tax=Nocardioides sp. CFH 31398 TaxID=2919579 RepID=UPI001F06E48B|nr:hypothetical protein [Nocardioides sp. CFH 31398]MCH1865013.1 hypothetical protein [Nocardioides sp. CFH 31398]
MALLFPVAAGAVTVAASATFEPPRGPDGPPRSAWQTVEFGGVTVDVPARWGAADLDGCTEPLAAWTVRVRTRCGQGPGVSFVPSATFDPPHGPGVRQPPDGPGPERWSGYVRVGDVAVDVVAGSRGVARRVLSSVEDEPSFR